MTVRGTLAAAVATPGLMASFAVPAIAKTVTIDPILTNDLKSSAATVSASGSTFDTPFFNAAFPVYSARNSKATINAYGGGGSGAGQTAIMQNLVNFGASDVPMMKSDIDAKSYATKGTLADYVQVPIVLGGVAIAFHNTTITDNKLNAKNHFNVTSEIIAKIYTGAITHGNDAAIDTPNPNGTST